MAKKKAWSETDLLAKGYTEVSKGKYIPASTSNASLRTNLIGSTYSDKTIIRNDSPILKGRPSKDELPVVDIIWKNFLNITKVLSADAFCRITLKGLASGINHGFQNQHWSKLRREKEQFVLRIKAINSNIHIPGKVRITYTRYSSRQLDWDNLCSTMKLPMDAIVKNGIIEDDSPDVVVEFIPKQIKCRRKDARMEFLIEKL